MLELQLDLNINGNLISQIVAYGLPDIRNENTTSDMYTDVRGSAFSVGIVEFVISPQPSVDSGRGSAGGSAYGMGGDARQVRPLDVVPAPHVARRA